MHADHAHRLAPDRDIDAHRAARLERGEMELLAVEDRRRLAHQQGIAVPAHAGSAHAEPDRAPVAVLLEQVRGEHRGALAGLTGEVIEGHLHEHVVHAEGDAERARAAEELVDVLRTYIK